MSIVRRLLPVLLCATGAWVVPSAGLAQDYPSKPVRVLIGFPPGQATDVLGRAVSQKLQEAWGQQFVVDNKPGASGTIATQLALQAPADGYTLLVSSSGVLAVNPGLMTKLPYDTVRDLAPVAGIAVVPLVLVANLGFPPSNVKDLVAAAKAKPGAINYASSGIGITNHLVMAMFLSAAGVEMTHVPYKGGPPALTDLMGGQVQVMFETSVAALPFVKQGRLKALAVSSAERVSAAPDIPTVAEQGVDGFEATPWFGLATTAGTPAAVVEKLNAAVRDALRTPALQARFSAMAVELVGDTPAEFTAYIDAESRKWKDVVRRSGARAD